MDPRDRSARVGVAGFYFVQGLCFAGLVTQIPTLQHKFGFTDNVLTVQDGPHTTELSLDIATPDEAREMLHLKGIHNVGF